ncbi:hypothetical protein D3C73_1531070 [compost metagenome]
MLDGQRNIAARALQFAGQIRAHDIQRGKGFTGVTEQGLRVDVRNDGKDIADRVGAFWIAQVSADEGVGDIGESGKIDSVEG